MLRCCGRMTERKSSHPGRNTQHRNTSEAATPARNPRPPPLQRPTHRCKGTSPESVRPLLSGLSSRRDTRGETTEKAIDYPIDVTPLVGKHGYDKAHRNRRLFGRGRGAVLPDDLPRGRETAGRAGSSGDLDAHPL